MPDTIHTVTMFVLAPAGLLCALLVLHSIRRRGWMDTFVFMAIGLPFFWARELWANSENMYVFQSGGVTVFNVRLVGIVGWFFTSYNALAVVEDILAKYFSKHKNGVFITAALTAVVTIAIAGIVETAGQNMGWWTASEEGIRAFPIVIHGAHWFAPAWASTVIVFLLPYLAACAIFNLKPDVPAINRLPAQIAVNCLLLSICLLVFLFKIGNLSTAILPALALIFGLIPFSARLKY